MTNFTIERHEMNRRIEFRVVENGVATTRVEVFPPDQRYGEMGPAEVSWPSTSDQRPALAEALAMAMLQAAAEAKLMNRNAGLEV